MEKLHVLVTAALAEADLDRIAAVDPKIEVSYAVEEVRVERHMLTTHAPPWGRPLGPVSYTHLTLPTILLV